MQQLITQHNNLTGIIFGGLKIFVKFVAVFKAGDKNIEYLSVEVIGIFTQTLTILVVTGYVKFNKIQLV
jgi:hypothetical protein